MAEEKKVGWPEWYANELVLPFRSKIASTFLLHGNIHDLIPNPDPDDRTQRSYINLTEFIELVSQACSIVIFYNIASGMRFVTSEMEDLFKSVVGIKEDDSAKNAIDAAKSKLSGKRGLPREPEACLPLIEKALKSSERVAVIINSVHFLAPASSGGGILSPQERVNIERLKNWSDDKGMRERGSIVILATDQAGKVAPELRQSGNGVRTIIIPKPSLEERAAFIENSVKGAPELTKLCAKRDKLQKQLKQKKGSEAQSILKELEECIEAIEEFPEIFTVPKGFDAGIFARATQGMSLQQIYEIFLQGKSSGNAIDLEFVKQKKRQILNEEFGDVMEVVEAERGLEDIGGLQHVKDFFDEVLRAIREGDTPLVPMGVNMMGPPGTGKTALAEALAKEAAFNFVKIKNIRSMWVGESEARQEKMIYGLKSLAPVIVMNDEADLAEASRDSQKGDSGVSERLMKMWMEMLSDPRIRGKIVVINCTNRPDRMDAALKRSGRADERLLIPMPSAVEREMIFRVMFKRHSIDTTIKDFAPFAKLTNGLSGADIEKISRDSLRFARKSKRAKVAPEDLQEAVSDFIPSASQKEIDTMTLCSLLESSSRRLLPAHTMELVKEIWKRHLVDGIDELFQQIKDRNIIEIDFLGSKKS